MPMRHSSATLEALHDLSGDNRDAIERAVACGCFHCLEVFDASAVVEWLPGSDEAHATAICPHCGIDSVIPARDGGAIDMDMLRSMRAYWFERPVTLPEEASLMGELRVRMQPLVRRLTWDLWLSRRSPIDPGDPNVS